MHQSGYGAGVIALLWLLLTNAAWAQDDTVQDAASPTWTPGMTAISDGDRARWAGDRHAARDLYRQAADSQDPAAQAMARLRLMSFSGNYGVLAHGGRLDRALYAGDPGPWLYLAWADYHLFLPGGLGVSKSEAERYARAAYNALPGPAAARLYLATGDPVWLDELAQASDRDGLGDALLANEGRLPPEPGTWLLSVGVAAAPGAGVGGGATFVHPDLGLKGWYVSTSTFATTYRSYLGSGTVRTPACALQARDRRCNDLLYDGARGYAQASAVGARTNINLYQGDVPTVTRLDLVQATVGPGFQWQGWSLQGGARVRWDALHLDGQDTALSPAHGPWGSVMWNRATGWGKTRRGWQMSGTIDWSALGYAHLGYGLDVHGYVGFLRGVTAARVTWDQELLDAPIQRLPTAGGPDRHRGAWVGRYRDPRIATADLEQRWQVLRPLELVIFGNVAWVADSGFHPAGGGGIRIILPPEGLNVVRFDVAVSDSGWGIYTAFGETF